jgi:hypothetical protein
MKNMFFKDNTKSIEEIMTEVKNISVEQLAATTADEPAAAAEPNPLPNISKVEDELKDIVQENWGTPSPCVCNNILPFCCKVSVPNGFDLSYINIQQKLSVVSNLYCFTDPVAKSCTVTLDNCNQIPMDLYPVRVIGCIHLSLFAFALIGDCGIEGPATNPNGTPLIPRSTNIDKSATGICCQDTICVDNIVNFSKTSPACDGTNCIPAPKLITCDKIKVIFNRVSVENCSCNTPGPNDTRLVVFKGQFILPTTCPA